MGQFTLFTGTITGVAGTLITVLDSILLSVGWTKPAGLIGTNSAAYLSGGACPVYLAVNDNSPSSSGKEGLAAGFEAMSGPATGTLPGVGTNQFPQTGQGSNTSNPGYFVRKSFTADTTARTYYAYADAGTLYLFIFSGDPSGSTGKYTGFAFGEFDSFKAGDGYRNLIIGRSAGNSPLVGYESLDVINTTVGGTAYLTSNGVVQRPYTGVAGSVYVSRMPDMGSVYWPSQMWLGQGALPYPNPADAKAYLSAVRLVECNPAGNAYTGVRGTMRGFWACCHPVASFNDGDTFSGTGVLAGRTFRFVKFSMNGGVYCIETSPTLSDP